MIKRIEIVLSPKDVSQNSYEAQRTIAAKLLRLDESEVKAVVPVHRSLDARSREPKYRVTADVYLNETPSDALSQALEYKPVEDKLKVVIVGFGPAGMFAALRLIELGIKPIVVERGKNVRERRRDLRAIQQDGLVNEDSNYCFGEGGAGTYSDGKLYTRSTKRGDVGKILKILVQHGASEEILIDAHPHIGSNKLPKIVQSIRETVISCGGEVHFESRVTDLIIHEKRIRGVVVNNDSEIMADAVILATGHSARDVFYMLDKRSVAIEAKPFALGVRIEHPQALIDEIQYHSKKRSEYLPAASYSLTCQVRERGVFSFCMCPGGIIVPASTAPGELVLNGMSVSRRDSPFANSGFVVSVTEEDLGEYSAYGAFAGIQYQMRVERAAFEAGGGMQTAPAQRVVDFVEGKLSQRLPDTSYIPGTRSSLLSEVFPKGITTRLREALVISGKKMRGYFTNEAQMLAAETRTSSPVRIPRDRESLMHVDIEGLFPSGEGAGYAGGIVSAAIDGENCASAAARRIFSV